MMMVGGRRSERRSNSNVDVFDVSRRWIERRKMIEFD